MRNGCKDFLSPTLDKLSDLDPYLECELKGFDLHLQWGEYDDSEIWIKIPKE